MSKQVKSTLRVHLWFETSKGMLFGPGRYVLLKNIIEHGSLNKAAKELGMSYRAAWGKMKQTEEELGVPLLEKIEGRKGFKLSALGRELFENYMRLVDEVEEYALKRAREMFPWQVNQYGQDKNLPTKGFNSD